MPTPSSSSAPTGRCAACAPISVGSLRDVMRKTRDDADLSRIFAQPLSLAFRVRHQRQNQRGPKVYSLHAPEVECIGKGKAHRPYEFGVKVSVATTLARSKGGQFIAHVKALPGNPYDGHTLETVIPEIETQIGASLARIVADRGYRGHNAPPDHKMKVYISGQKRAVTDAIKRDLRRRSAVESVIGHAKGEHRMGRNFLKGAHGDANAVLPAAGYNFRRLLAWLAVLWRVYVMAPLAAADIDLAPTSRRSSTLDHQTQPSHAQTLTTSRSTNADTWIGSSIYVTPTSGSEVPEPTAWAIMLVSFASLALYPLVTGNSNNASTSSTFDRPQG